MGRRRLDTLDTLAQYVLVGRLAALTLTLVILGRRVWPDPGLLFAFAVLIGFNYVALRRWPAVVAELHIADKPHYLALDCALAAAVLAIVGVGAPLVLYLVGTVLLAGLVYSRVSTAVAQVAVLGMFELAHWARWGYLPGGDDVHTLVTLPTLLLVGGFSGAAVRRIVQQNEESAARIGALQSEAAVREERLRVARDLHDSVTKNLHGVWLLARGVSAAATRGDLATVCTGAATVADTASDLAAQARGVIAGLRDDAAGEPLDHALGDVARRVAAGHALDVAVHAEQPLDVDTLVRQAMLAITAEAVHNTVKHAAAGRVDVRLHPVGDQVHLEVCDDGRGFDGSPVGGHFGLTGMRERAERVGGQLHVRSRPGAGTRVELRVPVAAVAAGGALRVNGGPRGTAPR